VHPSSEQVVPDGVVVDEPTREYVGMIWIADQPGEYVRVVARSLVEDRKEVERIYVEGHGINTHDENDADGRR
jgi:hypothetical protein